MISLNRLKAIFDEILFLGREIEIAGLTQDYEQRKELDIRVENLLKEVTLGMSEK